MATQYTAEYRADSLWQFAIHESGHVLLGVKYGMKMTCFNCEFNGFMHHGGVDWGPFEAPEWQVQAVFGAGAAAMRIRQETIAPPFRDKNHMTNSINGDVDDVNELMGTTLTRSEFLNHHGKLATEELLPHRDGIDVIARYICECNGAPDLVELERIARVVLDGR